MRRISKGYCRVAAVWLVAGGVMLMTGAGTATAAPQLICRKVVAEEPSGEPRNAAKGSRVKCPPGEMLTGGTCYADIRPESDGSCQTSAMGIIQPIIDHPGTTEEAFFTCLQTGGSSCPVEARTRAMAICCKVGEPQGAAGK